MKSVLTSLLLLSFVSFIAAQLDPSIQITSPTPNQNITSGSRVPIIYNIVGAGYISTSALTNNSATSLTLDLVWTSKADGSVLKINAERNLISNPSASPQRNRTYTNDWIMPGCHFFLRYKPENYNFVFSFTPVYNQESNKIEVTQGNGIVVPLVITVNSTTFPKC